MVGGFQGTTNEQIRVFEGDQSEAHGSDDYSSMP